jgi:hypothetical protein
MLPTQGFGGSGLIHGWFSPGPLGIWYFPAAGNFAANFFAAKGEFCRFRPKSANFCPEAGNGAGILGN